MKYSSLSGAFEKYENITSDLYQVYIFKSLIKWVPVSKDGSEKRPCDERPWISWLVPNLALENEAMRIVLLQQ